MPATANVRVFVLLAAAGVIMGGCGFGRAGYGDAGASMAQVKVEQTQFSGWRDAWKISNPVCEMVVVPSLCRVMRLAWKDGDNLLWVSPSARGQTYPVDDRQWHNLGGDKVWPTQQSRWHEYTDRQEWPPPLAFDSGVGRVESIPGGLRLISPLDPDFGAVCVREFVMDPVAPRVRLHQYFEKRTGSAADMSFWTITQVGSPTLALLPLGGIAQDGLRYRYLGVIVKVRHATLAGESVVLRISPEGSQKVGVSANEARNNGWVAATFATSDTLLVESHRLESDGVYPDDDCHAELYTDDGTNGPYIELELLSPLRALHAGERLVHDEIWQLVRLPPGTADDPATAAKAAREAHAAALAWLAR